MIALAQLDNMIQVKMFEMMKTWVHWGTMAPHLEKKVQKVHFERMGCIQVECQILSYLSLVVRLYR
jgi:hypothetical protein